MNKEEYKKVHLSYSEYEKLVNELGDKLKGKIDMVYGNCRGGWPIAVHLSHYLNIPILVALDGQEYVAYNKLLVVDDICDKGKVTSGALKSLQDRENIITASLYVSGHYTPDIFLRIKKLDEWIVFPWERMDEEPNR